MSHNYAAAIEPLQYGQPDLPPRPEKSVQRFQEEREQDAWYWRALATLAAFLIMIGFLVFPGAFRPDDNDSNDQATISLTVGALVIINVGYILSVALWFLRKNWIYQLECIFIPCFMSSTFGFINTLIVPNLILRIHIFTAPAMAAIIVSGISSVIYGLLCVFMWKRLDKLRKLSRQALHQARNPAWRSDEELQRGQWNTLYHKKETITASQLQAHRTYHIDPILPTSKSTDPYGSSSNTNYNGEYHTM